MNMLLDHDGKTFTTSVFCRRHVALVTASSFVVREFRMVARAEQHVKVSVPWNWTQTRQIWQLPLHALHKHEGCCT